MKTTVSPYPGKEKTNSVLYQCPMKCEGDKTYNAPGNCPVCHRHFFPAGAGEIYY